MNMYSIPYGASSVASVQSKAQGAFIWTIVSIVLAIVGALVLYFTFLNKKNETKFTGFLGWLYDFLNFKNFTVEVLLKVTYLIIAIFITLSSFSLITVSFWSFLLTLVLGNLLVRIIYEFALIKLVICRNTTEINKKLSKKDDQ